MNRIAGRMLHLSAAQMTDNQFHLLAAQAIRALLLREARRFTSASYRLGLLAALRDLEKGTGRLFRPTDLHDAAAEAFVGEFHFDLIRRLVARQSQFIRLTVAQAVSEGLGVRETGRLLGVVMRSRRFELLRIARTETNRAANWGRYSSWKTSGLVERKEFIATHDDQVRPDHLAADGETVPLNEPFTRGAASGYLMPPLAANCRCSAGPVTQFSGLAAAARREIPGLRALEDQQARRYGEIWQAWAQELESLFERHDAGPMRIAGGLN